LYGWSPGELVGTLKDLGVGILVVALGRWLDGIDSIVSWSVAVLPPPKVILPTPITIVVAAVAVVIVPIITVVVAAPIIAPVVGAVILLVGSRSPANVFLDLWVGLVSVCPLLRHRECNTHGVCLASLHQHEHFLIMCILLSHALLLKHIIETSTTFLLHLCYMSILRLLIIGPC
jgi:hypothetical protein